jgi:MutS-like protein
MHPGQDFDLQRPLPWNEQALTEDLELDTLFDAMATGDQFLRDICRRAVLCGLDDPDQIRYRQRVLTDCLAQPTIVRELYQVAVETIQAEKNTYWVLWDRDVDAILYRSMRVLGMFVGALTRLRRIADRHRGDFRSEGFTVFFEMIVKELDDEYLRTVQDHLRRLEFRDGVLISAELGQGNKGTDYVLCAPHRRQSWIRRMSQARGTSYTYRVPEGDDDDARALRELKGRGTGLVGAVLAQSNDHILSFFTMLRAELAFYVGCLNLHDRLMQAGEPTCLPVPLPPGLRTVSFTGLYNVTLTLNLGGPRAVGNDLHADDKSLLMITGANQGGKSTFLRSIGLAQLMTQCGMFVGAESFHTNVCRGLFTHFKREEDATMRSGKLDEELHRMSEMVDHLGANSMVLFNESFAATNEREGSQIARQILRALIEARVKVAFVTHLYDLAHSLYDDRTDSAVFLRSERRDDGRRTFKLVIGEPLPTSYGEDLYHHIFGADRHVPADSTT